MPTIRESINSQANTAPIDSHIAFHNMESKSRFILTKDRKKEFYSPPLLSSLLTSPLLKTQLESEYELITSNTPHEILLSKVNKHTPQNQNKKQSKAKRLHLLSIQLSLIKQDKAKVSPSLPDSLLPRSWILSPRSLPLQT